jgi:hypothetical protein
MPSLLAISIRKDTGDAFLLKQLGIMLPITL